MTSYTNQYGETFATGDVGSRIIIGKAPTEVEITKFSASGKNMFAVDRQGNEYSFSTKDRRERKSTNFVQFSKNKGLGQIASMLTGRGTVLNVGQKIRRYKNRQRNLLSFVVVVGFSDSGKNVFTQAPGEEIQSFSIKTGDERRPGNDEISLIAYPEDQNEPLKKKEEPKPTPKEWKDEAKNWIASVAQLVKEQIDLDLTSAFYLAGFKQDDLYNWYDSGKSPEYAVEKIVSAVKKRTQKPKQKTDFSNLDKWLATNEEKIEKYKSGVSFRKSEAFNNVINALKNISDKDKVIDGLTYDQYKNEVAQLFRENYPNAENVQQIKRLINDNPNNLIKATWDSGGSVEAGMLMFITNYITRGGTYYIDWRDEVKTITVEKGMVHQSAAIQFQEIDRPYGKVLRDTFINNETPMTAVTSIEILKKYA
jgi:hypothetical protein